MSDYYVSSIPVIGELGTLMLWVLAVNVLLVAGVVFFAYRAATLRSRVEELEARLAEQRPGPAAPTDEGPSPDA